jgi:hypothetical protein
MSQQISNLSNLFSSSDKREAESDVLSIIRKFIMLSLLWGSISLAFFLFSAFKAVETVEKIDLQKRLPSQMPQQDGYPSLIHSIVVKASNSQFAGKPKQR